jgi:hypothetical protein
VFFQQQLILPSLNHLWVKVMKSFGSNKVVFS